MGVGDQCHATLTSGQGRTHATHCTGGWVDPSDGKSCPPPGFDRWIVQQVAILTALYQPTLYLTPFVSCLNLSMLMACSC